jgi:nucleotide-binding universal stress UspA family protein
VRFASFPDHKESAMLHIKTILHPTDFSANSEPAFRLACSLARDYGARLIVLHVAAPPVVFYTPEMFPAPVEDTRESVRERLLLMKPRSPETPVEHRLSEGEAPGEILRAARETKCDVIVMGTHGRTGLGRLLLGSVAEQVLRRAPCPVVTVKKPLPAPTPAEEAPLAATTG